MTTNAVMALPAVELNVSQPHKPRITSKIRPFRKFWPGNVCGFSNFPSSFKYAIALPENDSEPMSVANSIEPAMNAVLLAEKETWSNSAPFTDREKSSPCARFKNSRPATSAAAPPPRPLNSATICGIAVIFTEYAPAAPRSAR